MKAIVLGATGAIGKDLITLLLNDAAFDKVEIFVRRNTELNDTKLLTHIVDFDKYNDWKHLISGDVVFSCLGTTLKAAGSKEAQYKVDYTYQYEFAQAAAEHGASTYILVSSAMANAKSRVFYTRMKGELEDAVQKLPFKRICIIQPPALIRKDTDRITEKLSLPVLKFFNRLGLFNNQAPMETEIVAEAMLNIAKGADNPKRISGQAIYRYSKHK